MVGGMDGGQMDDGGPDGGPCRTSILCVQKFGHSAATLEAVQSDPRCSSAAPPSVQREYRH